MKLVCVDPGTYSLKYLVVDSNKKSLDFVDLGEVVLAPHLESTQQDIHQLQVKIVDELLADYHHQAKLSLTLPSELITTRIISLPVKNKKKAELMIPFQLEEELPYSPSELHFSCDLETKGDQTQAIVSIVKKSDFEQFYLPFQQKDLPIHFLTSQLSLLSKLVKEQNFDGDFCILDIGHTTSRAYFFKDHELVSQHVSYVAGKNLTEAIAKSYNIDLEDAVQYKHQNAFVLTQEQLLEVNDSQRKFATLMDEVLSGLIQDLKKWELGFRVNFQQPIENIYLTGGSSQMKNIETYLMEKTGYPVSFLKKEVVSPIDAQGSTGRYLNNSLLAQAFSKRNKIANFLTGEYSSQLDDGLPLHSIFYNFLRVGILCFFIFIALMVENYFINKEISIYKSKVQRQLNSPELELSSSVKRNYARKPAAVLSAIKKRQDDIIKKEQAMKTLQDINAFSDLVNLSSISSQKEVILKQFSVDDQQNVLAVFQAKENASNSELSELKGLVEAQNWVDTNTTLSQSTGELTIRYRGGQ